VPRFVCEDPEEITCLQPDKIVRVLAHHAAAEVLIRDGDGHVELRRVDTGIDKLAAEIRREAIATARAAAARELVLEPRTNPTSW